MVQIILTVRKYGEMRENETLSFNSLFEAEQWHKNTQVFTKEAMHEEDEAGESLYKYSANYTFSGKTYFTYLDC